VLPVLVVIVVGVAAVSVRWFGRVDGRWGLAAVLLVVAVALLGHAGWWWLESVSWDSDYQGTPDRYREDLTDPHLWVGEAVVAGAVVVVLVVALVRLGHRRDLFSAVGVAVCLMALGQMASPRLLLPAPEDAGFQVFSDGELFGSPTRAIEVSGATGSRSLGLALVCGCACVAVAAMARWRRPMRAEDRGGGDLTGGARR